MPKTPHTYRKSYPAYSNHLPEYSAKLSCATLLAANSSKSTSSFLNGFRFTKQLIALHKYSLYI